MISPTRTTLLPTILAALALGACGGASPGAEEPRSEGPPPLTTAEACEYVEGRIRATGAELEDEGLGGVAAMRRFEQVMRDLDADLDRPVVAEAQPLVDDYRAIAQEGARAAQSLAETTPVVERATPQIEALGADLERASGLIGDGCQSETAACAEFAAALEGLELDSGAAARSIAGLEAIEPGPEETNLRAAIDGYLSALRELRDIAELVEGYQRTFEEFQSAADRLGRPADSAVALCQAAPFPG